MPLLPDASPWSHDGGQIGVLLIHGFTGSPKSMKPWGHYLADRGYTVRVPRLPGHGTRWQDMNLTTWDDWFAEADRNLAELSAKCETVFVMGLSMGGSLALRLAEAHGPAIKGIVVVNPAVHTERPDRHLLPYIRHLVPAFPGISNDIKKPGADEGAYTKIPLQAAYSLQKGWAKIKSDIGKVHQPVLLFRSSVDHVVEASNSHWLMANMPSNDKTEVVLENSYHVATLDNDAELIFEGSVEFIKRLAG
jgi:carboxylesterase